MSFIFALLLTYFTGLNAHGYFMNSNLCQLYPSMLSIEKRCVSTDSS